MNEELEKFKEEFPVLLHMFMHNQGGFELIGYRNYGKDDSKKLILLFTDRYKSKTTNVYLKDDRNLLDWEIEHVNIGTYSRQRIKLEIVLRKEIK